MLAGVTNIAVTRLALQGLRGRGGPHKISGSVHTTQRGNILRSGQQRQLTAWRTRQTAAGQARVWTAVGAEVHLKSVMENRPEWHRRDRRCSASSLSSRRSMSYRLQQWQVQVRRGGHGPRLRQLQQECCRAVKICLLQGRRDRSAAGVRHMRPYTGSRHGDKHAAEGSWVVKQ